MVLCPGDGGFSFAPPHNLTKKARDDRCWLSTGKPRYNKLK